MDPLSTLNLAASVVEFVQFASPLLVGSPAELSERDERTRPIHDSLYDFASRLENGSPDPKVSSASLLESDLSTETPTLAQLARNCRDDCKVLLLLVERAGIRNDTGANDQASFRTSLVGVLEPGEIEQLQERLEGYQRLMVLHLCSASRDIVDDIGSKDQRAERLSNIVQAVNKTREKIDAYITDEVKKSLSRDEIELLTVQVLHLSQNGQKFAQESALLRSLEFDQMPVRHENIIDAHKTTLNWIFAESTAEAGGDVRITEWLRGGQGVFWVTGLPGSGSDALVKACHYFWSAGSHMQRSQEGLLRALLHDILRQSPDLIPLLCPDQWERLGTGQVSDPSSLAWSISELHLALQRISTQTQLSFKFCFIIDGLDEYGGDHAGLCELLIQLTQCSFIKLLVSSRSWNVFEDNFGNSSHKLRLHDLTKKDIRDYAESRLRDHPNWEKLVERYGEQPANSLIEDIRERSRGVFLWVFLVTRQLRDGLADDDSLPQLQQKLDQLPSDLENFFELMLESVDPTRHQRMSGSLQIALAAKRSLPLEVYGFHDLEYQNPEYATKEPTVPWSHAKTRAFTGPVMRRLASRCKGLLIVSNGRVEFLHRTVRDFLRTAKMRDFLVKKGPLGFDPAFSILRAYIATIKHYDLADHCRNAAYVDGAPDYQFLTTLRDMLSYANDVTNAINMEATTDLLDDIELSVVWIVQSAKAFPLVNAELMDQPTEFRRLCLCAALDGYIARRFEEDDDLLSDQPIPPLATVLRARYDGTYSDSQVKLVHALLLRGEDPNQPYRESEMAKTPWTNYTWRFNPGTIGEPIPVGSTTPWSAVASTFHSDTLTELFQFLEAGVVPILLDFGAEVNLVDDLREHPYQPAWVSYLKIVFSPNFRQYSSHIDAYLRSLDKMLDRAKLDLRVPPLFSLLEWVDEHVDEISSLILAPGRAELEHVSDAEMAHRPPAAFAARSQEEALQLQKRLLAARSDQEVLVVMDRVLPGTRAREWLDFPQTARSEMFRSLGFSLRNLKTRQLPSYHHLQMMVQAIKVFLRHAAHPQQLINELMDTIRDVIPLEMQPALLNMLHSR
ncbi:hypothetical protein GQ53DRAFT_812944 [Thozetella sp. PMI_491]|nr:hypothetical protein GQ53DRAFT_812944 [Thozetella sp. PMI_491]